MHAHACREREGERERERERDRDRGRERAVHGRQHAGCKRYGTICACSLPHLKSLTSKWVGLVLNTNSGLKIHAIRDVTTVKCSVEVQLEFKFTASLRPQTEEPRGGPRGRRELLNGTEVLGPVCSHDGCQKLKAPTTQRSENNLLKKGVCQFSVWTCTAPEDVTGLLTPRSEDANNVLPQRILSHRWLDKNQPNLSPPNKTFFFFYSSHPSTSAARLTVLFNLICNSCHNNPGICHVLPQCEPSTRLIAVQVAR